VSSFAVGSLVSARGREWVVLPESEPDLLILRPLGATDAEIAEVVTIAAALRAGAAITHGTHAFLGA